MSMDKPNKILPSSPTSTLPFMPPQLQDPSLKGVSFDQLLSNRGIRFIHRKALPCPNIDDLNANTHVINCPICDGSGMIYYHEKEIYGVFYSNSLEKQYEHHGVWEVGSAVITLPVEYSDGTQADFNTFDHLYIPDFTVRMWEMKEYEKNPGNIQKLRYPIQKIDTILSADTTTLKEYKVDIDFNLVDGNIVWIAGKEPNYNYALGRGDVLAIAYYANPVYTVVQHMRELRITQEMGTDGKKIARRLPQQIMVRRDYLANPPETDNRT